MSIQDESELLALKEAGRVVRLVLDAMVACVQPGISTAEVAEAGSAVMRTHGACSAPKMVYGFPGEMLISLNDEAVHGIPSASRKIRTGDLVKLDVTLEKNGYMADAAMTVCVPPVSAEAQRLASCAERAFRRGLRHARAGRRVNEIGRAVEQEVRRSGFRVIRELGGHGIGRTIHEAPSVPNFDDPSARKILTNGMVLTIEPIVAAGSARPKEVGDGWTIKTADGALAAHYEHTIVITDGAPILLTAA